MSDKADLPIIDLRSFISGSDHQRQAVADQTMSTCESAGFFYLTGHGIEESQFVSARNAALDFFRAPASVKTKVHITTVAHHRGYVGNFDVAPDTKKGGDIREAYKVALDLDESDPDYLAGITLYGPNIWPVEFPHFQTQLYGVYLEFQKLAVEIFNLFAVGLKLPADFFTDLIEKPASVMNVNYYPAHSPNENTNSGIGAHSDYEAFAMLWQDGVAGLEIETRDNMWKHVEPVPGTLVINIGDLMARWTNDRFRATRHRVINISGKERVSMACFGNTNFHAPIECIPSCCSPSNPARYAPTTAGEYLMGAINRTYAYTKTG